MEARVKKIRAGSSEELERLLQDLKPLIISSIKRYYYLDQDFPDLVQEGYRIVLQALEDYDPRQKVYFLGYVKMQLRFFYLDQHKLRRHTSLNAPNDQGQELVDCLEDRAYRPCLDRLVAREEHLDLYRAYEDLAPRQKEVIDLYYIREMNMKEIGQALGISYRSVVNTKTRALEVLREGLEKSRRAKK